MCRLRHLSGCASADGARVGTVRTFDLREGRPQRTLLDLHRLRGYHYELNSIHASEQRPHLFAVGGGDQVCRVFDRRWISPANRRPLHAFEAKSTDAENHITGVHLSKRGDAVLARYASIAAAARRLAAPDGGVGPLTDAGVQLSPRQRISVSHSLRR